MYSCGSRVYVKVLAYFIRTLSGSIPPSTATKAVDGGMDPDKVRRIGRWKTTSVFYEHYVFDRTPDEYIDNLFE